MNMRKRKRCPPLSKGEGVVSLSQGSEPTPLASTRENKEGEEGNRHRNEAGTAPRCAMDDAYQDTWITWMVLTLELNFPV